ncbi:uncharacterized protein [Musca autumnalis]|uniref:uncharacterized protein n=1 Tax=Musca autumnalis TaxID=221902 RepID=UPI003CF1AFB6
MSTPNDGGNSAEELYRGGINPNVPQPPPPQIQQYVSAGVPPQFVHWPNPLIGGTPFMQQHQQHHPHPPPQQLFNDVLFNIQAQAYASAAVPATPAPQQETYSVLRVGNGNFLKIYHCPENAMGPLPGETSFAPLHHAPPPPPPPFNPQPQQQQAYHHIQQQQAASVQPAPPQQQQQHSQAQQQTPSHIPPNNNSGNSAPQIFNSYELFSSNTFTQLPTAEMPPVLLLGTTNSNLNEQPITITEEFDEQQEQQQTTPPQPIMEENNTVANMTNNWLGDSSIPPLYDHFDNSSQTMQTEKEFLAQIELEKSQQHENFTSNDNSDRNTDASAASYIAIQPQQKQHMQQTHVNVIPKLQSKDKHTVIMQSPPPPALNHKSEIPRQEAPKKRIVAEVKPMRMTYSDVLSKINNQAQQNSSNYVGNNSNNSIRNQQKSSVKSSTDNNSISNSNNYLGTRRNMEEFPNNRSSKKSPTHDNKENQQQINNKNINNNKRSSAGATTPTANNATNTLNNKNMATGTSTAQKNSINNLKTNANDLQQHAQSLQQQQQQQQQHQQKKRINKNNDIQVNGGGKNGNDTRGSSKGNANTNNNNNNATASTNVYNATNNTYVRKATKSPNSSYGGTTSAGQQRSRYQNNSNASYSYSSTKRNRNNSSYGTSSTPSYGGGGSGPNNPNYELAKRFLKAWYSYTLKILIWLFNLVYDIVVVGCSILYDRLTSGYEYCKTYAQQLWKDLKQNSNKPSIWFKNTCRRFDARFSKTSKWAFWRRFYKKRPPDISSEATKTGRLPQTGEEAMYQLLNCKGKDAYSILGVPRNSSQEQIRKHYKKIAVLVHPDKNKQPGAEEAFKVLQRAFELIAEPENRLSYDQSLAEALHAEKAWTELHDLLSQLQTKITEAANTIRCSTCGLRHPRKMTDRPHYAARECASCKIRHSAREGDIWAETSMLGLRWKYLALMEGKVYDITEWANCQKGALAHLEPNSHMVQYRIVRGAQQQQQQQQQHKQQSHHQQQQQHQQHTGSHYAGGGGPAGGKFKRDNIPTTEASLHEFLDNLYSGQHPQQQNSSAYAGSGRRRNRR